MVPPRLPPNRVWTTVEFTDLRFAYSFLGAVETWAEIRWGAGCTSWTARKTRARR